MRLERGVKELGFQSDFIKVGKGGPRINLKLKSDEESRNTAWALR